jgi:hypothetical protein
MSLTVWMRVATLVGLLVVGTAIAIAWRAEIRDRAQLSGELAAAKEALDAADARRRDRDAKLAGTLAVIEAEKRTQQSPAEIARSLVLAMHLPAAVAIEPTSTSVQQDALVDTKGLKEAATGSKAEEVSGIQAMVPGQDLKPIHDFALDCQACQAKLLAAQSDLLDEKVKTKTLTKERDDALHVARGGSVLVRIARASKWLLIGAAAGAAAGALASR